MSGIDHIAYPCFDVRATVRFWTEVMGGELLHSQSGPAEAWKAKEYLLMAFELPGGAVIDFFAFDGLVKPADDGLPRDIRHIGVSMGTRAEVLRFKARLERDAIPFWTETHDLDDVHVYVTDPNGVVVELLAEMDGVRARKGDEKEAKRVIEGWLGARG
jgi:catechol 2,3-dioxygenase-like lactoylglutathione lyase family enzyme